LIGLVMLGASGSPEMIARGSGCNCSALRNAGLGPITLRMSAFDSLLTGRQGTPVPVLMPLPIKRGLAVQLFQSSGSF
jgi:hypothetical protein